ncbi:MAG: 1-deoxy-D-xylulose-5-phosphate synthase [Marinilabiliales bacterium]
MIPKAGPLLSKIDSPEDLRKLDVKDLPALCDELREFIIDVVSCNPGHFGASLGVVELTVALHYAYNTPEDLLVWDVGHQAYGHKIITGRRDIFHTNRKFKGISGFPKPDESIYDTFGVGHSSTSISAALGMAVAIEKAGKKNKVVAVIGDGSMTAGQAFEAMNNAGNMKSDLLVVLNDNNMAIDPNVGALKEYLLDISTSKTYNRVKNDVWRLLGKISKWGPNAQAIAQKIDNGIKSIILRHSNLFETLNFRYFGPVDGHDVVQLSKTLKDLREIPGPKLLHVLTIKGKGFKRAEIEQTKFHAPGLFDKNTGESIEKDTCDMPPKYQDVFGETITELAEKNEKIYGITPAMPTGCSLNIMMKKFPERAFDVGIAEQHAVTFSAGLATQGLIPYCNIYSSFMQRAYDQVIHDVAIQNLPVIFCLDRGGLVGEDGPTHHGVFDLAYFRCIPNMIIAAPMDEIELRNMLYTAQLNPKGPFVIRYPRGRGVHKNWKKPFQEIPVGKGRMISDGNDLAILSVGHPGNFVKKAIAKAEISDITVAHYDMIFVKPLDEKLLHEICQKFDKIITVEDGTVTGGFGSAVLEFINENNYKCKVIRLGVPDKFIEHGTPQQLHKLCGFDSDSIYNKIIDVVKKKTSKTKHKLI